MLQRKCNIMRLNYRVVSRKNDLQFHQIVAPEMVGTDDVQLQGGVVVCTDFPNFCNEIVRSGLESNKTNQNNGHMGTLGVPRGVLPGKK